MGPLRYLKFKLRLWAKASNVPEWVRKASGRFHEQYREKHGQPPDGVVKEFSGDSLRYEVKYRVTGRKNTSRRYRVKIK